MHKRRIAPKSLSIYVDRYPSVAMSAHSIEPKVMVRVARRKEHNNALDCRANRDVFSPYSAFT